MSDEKRITVVDLETTGLEPPEHAPVQIGFSSLSPSASDLFGKPCAWSDVQLPFSTMLNPGRPIPPESSAIHHFIDADIITEAPWREVIELIVPPIAAQSVAFAAHNARFEQQWLTPELVEAWALRAILEDRTPRADVAKVIEALGCAVTMRQWRARARGDAAPLDTAPRIDCIDLLAKHFPLELEGAGGVEALI